MDPKLCYFRMVASDHEVQEEGELPSGSTTPDAEVKEDRKRKHSDSESEHTGKLPVYF